MVEKNPEVLYEDNHVIVVLKPAGVLVQAGDERCAKSAGTNVSTGIGEEPPLLDSVKAFIKKRDGKPGNVFLGLVHRLDRNVAGIVLFAKTSKGASRLSEQFRLHTVEKVYHAWVVGKLEQKSAVLVHYLKHDERRNMTEVFDRERSDSQRAELSYEVVEERGEGRDETTLVKVSLKTGRHHQIRAQFSHVCHPVVGDVKYGAPSGFPDKHIELYATELHFDTATGGERKVIRIPDSVFNHSEDTRKH